jgi:hypothetical protein
MFSFWVTLRADAPLCLLKWMWLTYAIARKTYALSAARVPLTNSRQ